MLFENRLATAESQAVFTTGEQLVSGDVRELVNSYSKLNARQKNALLEFLKTLSIALL